MATILSEGGAVKLSHHQLGSVLIWIWDALAPKLPPLLRRLVFCAGLLLILVHIVACGGRPPRRAVSYPLDGRQHLHVKGECSPVWDTKNVFVLNLPVCNGGKFIGANTLMKLPIEKSIRSDAGIVVRPNSIAQSKGMPLQQISPISSLRAVD
jgi:hypothetical protein